jgi:transcriptional regulator with XRE-family HTH domain
VGGGMTERQRRKQIAKVIKDLREYFGYTERSLAEFLGLSLAGYKTLEYGNKPLTALQWVKLSNLYDVPTTYIYDEKMRKTYKLKKYKFCGYNNE